MNPFRSLAVVLALVSGLQAMPAMAIETQNSNPSATSNASGDPVYDIHAPAAVSMAGDLLIARPLLIGATIIGTALFVVSLPFSALGGNVDEAGRALVIAPGRSAFVRCLGCSGEQEQR